ncbi:MAG: hypothetical protein K5892_00405 [Acholeplasmatales bacterium]|nr:hypothetical protein [Acholeplasmatales bacterium]
MSGLSLDKNKLNNFINNNIDKSFYSLLNYYLNINKLTISKLVKLSNLDRRYVTKFKNKDYRPSKNTIIAVALGLKLKFNDLNILLNSCGYTISNSIIFDLIIQYFVESNYYDIDEINMYLFENGFKVLGTITRE